MQITFRNISWRSRLIHVIHRRTRQGAGGGQLPPPPKIFEKPLGQMLGQIKKIRADLSENMLKSGYFITILNKNSVKLSTPPRKTSVPFSYDVISSIQSTFPKIASQSRLGPLFARF
jgi:hypothetical protein